MSKREETPSFVVEMPLVASPSDETTVLTRLEAARQVLNESLGESLRRLALLRQSKVFHVARALPKGRPRSTAFAKANEKHGSREYDLHAYAKQFGHSWLGEHLDSLTVRALAERLLIEERGLDKDADDVVELVADDAVELWIKALEAIENVSTDFALEIARFQAAAESA